MKPQLQRYVQRHGWDRASSSYERYWRRQLLPVIDLLIDTAAVQPGEDVIEVACGTGMVTLPVAAGVGPGGRVLATDLSPGMVADLERSLRATGLTNVDVARGDAEAIDTSRTFDVALCSLGLMYVPDPAAAVRQLHDVLRPGGRTVISVWGERRHCGWAELFPIVGDRISSDVCPMFFALGSPGALAETLEQAGFVDVHETRIGAQLEYADDEQALGAAFLGGPVALAYARFDEATRASAHAAYLDSIAGFADGGGGYRVPGEFVVASGRRP